MRFTSCFWKEANLAEKYPSLYIEGYYEIIKELCSAILALEGWKALNHECLYACLQQKSLNREIDFSYLLELKDLLNSIGYRGVKVSPELWKRNNVRGKCYHLTDKRSMFLS